MITHLRKDLFIDRFMLLLTSFRFHDKKWGMSCLKNQTSLYQNFIEAVQRSRRYKRFYWLLSNRVTFAFIA